MKRGPYEVKKGRREQFTRAVELRHQGYGYLRISKLVDVPMFTIRNWVRDIPIDVRAAQSSAAMGFHKENPIGKFAIKRRLIAIHGNKCMRCGTEQWMGQPLTMEIHRLNSGPYKDAGLELLCPNCHSQTPNWCGKGKLLKLPSAS